ncbi:MAG TPA: hypothetical protein VGD98_07685 [Ktedonobacteraceae bacterium]
MRYSTPPFPGSNTSHGRAVDHPSGSSSSLRVVGLLLSLVSMFLALLAVFFSLQNVIVLLLAGLVFCFGARLFALWLRGQTKTPVPIGMRSRQAPALPPRQMGGDTPFPPQLWPASAPSRMSQGGQVEPVTPIPSTVDFYEQAPVLPPRGYAPFPPQPLPNAASAITYHSTQVEPVPPVPRAVGLYDMVELAPVSQPAASATGPLKYLSIEQDELFVLDPPIANERCFLLPKEGAPLVECQDRYALAARDNYRCYAVAAGVAGSFVAAPWASIVAKSFVQRNATFARKEEFQLWLEDCSKQWHTWIAERWVPAMNALHAQRGNAPQDWSEQIRKGAQTTLLACICDFTRSQANNPIPVTILSIGDCELFHFTPAENGQWRLQKVYPYQRSADFNARPLTLMTAKRQELVENAWMLRRSTILNVYSGDLLVLATDTLAKWILTQIERQTQHWQCLLSPLTPAEFAVSMRREFQRDQSEDDDITMLVIPI